MSVSDPLVKDLKGCVQQFINLINTSTPITDNNFYFVLFTQTLEKIFNKGLIRQQNTKFFERTIDPYSWMSSIASECSFAYTNCVDQVNGRLDLATNEGKLRLLIKYCLMKKCSHFPVEALVKSQHAQVFYAPSAILGDEILTEIFLSVLRQVANINFSLDLKNSSFLDLSWYIPDVVCTELVPCKTLGIAVSFAGNKAVIVNIQPASVAAEHGNIKIGDILDELNNTHINNSTRGRLKFIMKGNKLKPIKVRIAKAYSKDSGELYGPIKNILKDLKLDLDKIKKQYEENANEICHPQKSKSVYGYAVKHVGNVDVGEFGSVKQVQKALKTIMDTHCQTPETVKRVDKMVTLEIGEIGLKIKEKDTGNLLLDHPYMKISSCGTIPVLSRVFAYCAGEETCDIANNFTCYVFEAISFDDADLILQSIGQGFHRTHYAV
ncbi:unnamed protein product [Ceutorhynchus assimilis]|uniref:PDZ domain-containing protein n=1 Tax=Ceutorhynchus assimilis TaxID=467358 RepID=A0A9P0GT55_9CUCU|nr:unnamed protein product [Ceutorhynchus assimilis]